MSCGNAHNGKTEIVVCDNSEELANKTAELLVRLVNELGKDKDAVHIALSGGSTPSLLYERLVKEDFIKSMNWSKLRLYVSDERCVPMASRESNFGNAVRQFIALAPIDGDHVFPTRDQDRDPEKAALEYDRIIRDNLPLNNHGLPQFDVIFLGMGPDGHTASLFPGTEALEDCERLVVSNFVEHLRAERITFTYQLINSASNVIFMVKGGDKAEALAGVLEGKDPKYPSSKIDPEHGTLYWMIEKDAASKLKA